MADFTDDNFASLLHLSELELFEEIAGELEDLEINLPMLTPKPNPFISSILKNNQGSGQNNFSKILVATNRANQKKSGRPKVVDISKKSRRSRDISPTERERFEELGKEIADIKKDNKGSRRLPAVPPREEIFHLLEVSKEHERDHLIIRLAYATGCRRSELENMRLADINHKEQSIFVRDGKGNKDRYVLMDKTTARLLEEFTYGLGLQDPIFDIEDKQINRRIKHWGKKSGLTARYEAQDRYFTSHCLRHAYATHMHEAGVDLYTLKDLLGHRFLTTTKLYVHIGVGKRLAEYENCHPLAADAATRD